MLLMLLDVSHGVQPVWHNSIQIAAYVEHMYELVASGMLLLEFSCSAVAM